MVLSACGGLENPATFDDDPQTSQGYAIAEVPDGYELCGANVPSGLSVRGDEGPSMRVYGDTGLDDPYTGPLYAVALFDAAALDDLALGFTVDIEVQGRPARLGAIDGFQLAALGPDLGRTLTWQLDDGRIVQLAVRADPTADLVALAPAVRIDDGGATIVADALPDGFADFGDVYELEGQPRFRFSLDYQRRDTGAEDVLTLLGSEGDAVALEAFRFRASTSNRVTVGDRPGVTADIGPGGQGPWVVTWLAEDDLILRLFSFELEPDRLVPVAEAVVATSGADWTDLLAAHDPPTCR